MNVLIINQISLDNLDLVLNILANSITIITPALMIWWKQHKQGNKKGEKNTK